MTDLYPTLDLTPAEDREEPPGDSARPRVRWGGILWGLVLAAIASTALWITLAQERREGLADWITGLSPAAVAAYIVLTIGALALVAGLVGVARRVQRA